MRESGYRKGWSMQPISAAWRVTHSSHRKHTASVAFVRVHEDQADGPCKLSPARGAATTCVHGAGATRRRRSDSNMNRLRRRRMSTPCANASGSPVQARSRATVSFMPFNMRLRSFTNLQWLGSFYLPMRSVHARIILA